MSSAAPLKCGSMKVFACRYPRALGLALPRVKYCRPMASPTGWSTMCRRRCCNIAGAASSCGSWTGRFFNSRYSSRPTTALTPGKAESSLRARQRAKALERMRRDKEVFSQQELDEINSLYHAADKGLETGEARETRLKTLVAKYPKSNRAGCAVVYLGQASRGDEQIAYFKQAIADHGDCYYGDGVQVGAYARFLLGKAYLESGRAHEASLLFDDIRSNYPDAVDHGGDSLAAKLPPTAPTVEAAVAGPVDLAGGVSSTRQVLIVANAPYWQTLTDMVRRKGMTAGKSFNYNYDQWLPLAKGQTLLIETHDRIPIVPLSMVEKYYPGLPRD